MKKKKGSSVYRFGRALPIIPIPLFVILAVFLYLLQFGSSVIFDPPGLLPLLNLLFLFICPMVVGYLAAKGYLETGSATLITLGSGVFSLALGSLIAGFLLPVKGPNAVITIHNISAFLAGAFHFTGGAMVFAGFQPEQDAHKRKVKLIIIFTGIFALLVILTFWVLQGILPVFFVQAQGPALLRQIILGFAVLSFFLSGLLFMKLYRNSQSSFLYWYTLALFLISIGLCCVFLQKSFGSPIGWLGRIAQYIGGVYLVAAVFSGAREFGVKITRFDKILEKFFRNRFEVLLAERSAELVLSNEQLRREIDDRKRAEEELQEERNKLKSIVGAIGDGLSIQDLDYNISYQNDVLKNLFGDRVGEKCYLVYEGKDMVCDGCPVKMAYKDGNSHASERSAIMPSEGIAFWENIANPIRDAGGKIISCLEIARNITDRKQAEEEKRRLESQLQQSQKMEAVGTLAGGIAHDFNNILAIILGNAELASDDVPDSNPASKSLKEICLTSLRAKDMVHQLLAFSRKSDEEIKPVDMAPIIKGSMKMLRSAVPTSVEFKQHISDDPCSILGDAAQINQIVMNLVINAADAMSEEGGLLEVTLAKIILQEEKACFDWVLSPGLYIRLRMRDTGEGIEPEIMDRIFDPYYTTKEVGKGTGMGLSVIHGIIKRHGGGILVESEIGKGTVFEIYFPALEETAEEEKPPDGEIKGGAERILFVDDEESMVDLNRQRLERLGYQVKSTTKPVEALEWFKANPDQFDVIITDMAMPRMTGDRLAAEVLKIRPHMPVIICTGYSERMSAKKAAALGVRKYIEKPIELRNLASSIREVLEGK